MAKLNRLARNVAFVANLVESGVGFETPAERFHACVALTD